VTVRRRSPISVEFDVSQLTSAWPAKTVVLQISLRYRHFTWVVFDRFALRSKTVTPEDVVHATRSPSAKRSPTGALVRASVCAAPIRGSGGPAAGPATAAAPASAARAPVISSARPKRLASAATA